MGARASDKAEPRGQQQTPMTQPPMTSQWSTPASSLRELPRRAIGSRAAMSRVDVAQGDPRFMDPKDRNFSRRDTDEVIYPKNVPQRFLESKFMQTPLHKEATSKTFVGVVVNQNDSIPYKSQYPEYGIKASNRVSKSTRAHQIVYSVDNVSMKNDKLLNSQGSSVNHFRTSPYQYDNATKYAAGAQNERNSSRFTGDLQKHDPQEEQRKQKHDPQEEQRKLALKNLLIRPIVIMRGEAWDESDWKDFNAPHNFHTACADFLKIIALTENKYMAMEIKDFLTSDLLTPRYTEENQPSQQGKKLNHFHVFWNMMHQLPFSVKMWDRQTKEKLKLFYEVWIPSTILCGYCRGHYQAWIKKQPPLVSDRVSLNQWLFRLHNDVNQRTSKPQFQWDKYNQRWGQNDRQFPDERMGGTWTMRTPSKSISKFHGSSQTSTSRTWTTSSSVNVEDLQTLRMYQSREQNPRSSFPNMSLPRRCLSNRQLYLRQNNMYEQNGPILPRSRVSVKARGFHY